MEQVGQTRPGRISDAPPGAASYASTAPAAANPAEFINETVRGHKVALFSKTVCPHCRKAKEVLASAGMGPPQLEVVDLDTRQDGDVLQDTLERQTGKRTVPQIFINGAFIGGAEELDQLASSGQLAQRLG